MAKTFKIIDQFKIAGYGTVYMINQETEMDLHLDDILYDLRGHRFQIAGFELLKQMRGEIPVDQMPVCILLKFLDKVEVHGGFLVDSLHAINFLFCNHPLYQNHADEDYKDEYQEAKANHPCSLFSYEDMENGILSLYGESISGLTVYRGWMMKPEMYRKFYALLQEKGIILINSPEEYERCHLLPGWYPTFKEETMDSVWEDTGTLASAMALAENLHGTYIVKDYVKSRKHEWYDSCFIPNIEDKENTERIIKNFIERQGLSLAGGIVLRKFVNLRSIGFHKKSGMPLSEEYRFFVLAGDILCFNDYWEDTDQNSLSNEEIEWIRSMARKIQSNFAVIDIARTKDGALIVMELGDGQVSGLQQLKASSFISAFDRN